MLLVVIIFHTRFSFLSIQEQQSCHQFKFMVGVVGTPKRHVSVKLDCCIARMINPASQITATTGMDGKDCNHCYHLL